MDSAYQKIFPRNIGVFPEAEQEKINNSMAANAGMGGVDGLVAEKAYSPEIWQPHVANIIQLAIG